MPEPGRMPPVSLEATLQRLAGDIADQQLWLQCATAVVEKIKPYLEEAESRQQLREPNFLHVNWDQPCIYRQPRYPQEPADIPINTDVDLAITGLTAAGKEYLTDVLSLGIPGFLEPHQSDAGRVTFVRTEWALAVGDCQVWCRVNILLTQWWWLDSSSHCRQSAGTGLGLLVPAYTCRGYYSNRRFFDASLSPPPP